MRISVVIPAFNEEGNIGRLIEETFAAVPKSALGEVIAVDDASDDGRGLKSRRCSANIRLCAISGTGKGRGKARRSGRAFGPPAIPSSPPWTATGRTIRPTSCVLAKRLGGRGQEPAMAAGIRAGRKGPGSRKAASRFANWHARQSARRWLPRHRLRHQAVSPPSLSRASVFYNACTAICRRSFSPMATKLPMRR